MSELGDDKTNTAMLILACTTFFRTYISERCNHINQFEETNLINNNLYCLHQRFPYQMISNNVLQNEKEAGNPYN